MWNALKTTYTIPAICLRNIPIKNCGNIPVEPFIKTIIAKYTFLRVTICFHIILHHFVDTYFISLTNLIIFETYMIFSQQCQEQGTPNTVNFSLLEYPRAFLMSVLIQHAIDSGQPVTNLQFENEVRLEKIHQVLESLSAFIKLE